MSRAPNRASILLTALELPGRSLISRSSRQIISRVPEEEIRRIESVLTVAILLFCWPGSPRHALSACMH
jgi:hypothetical protein